MQGDSKLHRLILDYGMSSLYEVGSPEYHALSGVFKITHGTGIKSLCETLRHLNQQHWHMAGEEMEQTIEALRWLPASEFNLFYDEAPRDYSKAWEFAKLHHDGSIGNLLRIYREVCGATSESFAERAGMTKEGFNQYERGGRSFVAKRTRALSCDSKNPLRPLFLEDDEAEGNIENLWQLPTEPGDPNKIRADVVMFIESFDQGKKPVPPESRWLSIADALEQLGIAAFEVEYFRDKEVNASKDQGGWVQRITGYDGLEYMQGNKAFACVKAELDKALEPYEGEKLPLIELGGQEYLVKRDKEGKVLVQERDLERLRPWLHDVVNGRGDNITRRQLQAVDARATVSSQTTFYPGSRT